ncbi:nuclear transport factor 2 family protein [Luteimonas sp. SX5]|uniref:Nuclear transport factor 2 family protein n=1 Tax=Luteimonas galliterrae TaxID=2940486 RepID=A0ABT0MI97_9GAMM|nr:nuclear transport factor 2 family protein [Luteimonas galliterrae]MCL1634596.1 nuclear transport factor 2 family protein [Luteimonas galliterrae]
MGRVLPMLLSSYVIFVCSGAAQAQPAPETGVAAAIQAYDRAWAGKDPVAFERTLAADYVYFTSKGGVRSRQQWVEFLGSPKFRLASAERSEIQVHRTADTAVVGSRWKGHGSYDGKPFRDDQRCSIVLARSADGWKVLSEHCVQIVEG